jgi:hypothetical protein
VPGLFPLPPDPRRLADLRAQAALVRTAADAIEAALRDLAPFDRPDVWSGGRATEFRAGLADQQALLTTPEHGALAQLRDAARRIEIRADAMARELDDPPALDPPPDLRLPWPAPPS